MPEESCSCCFIFRKETEDDKKNREIDKQLRQHRKNLKKEYRILLLGCGGAGKSTFIKQMHIIHSQGFSTEERLKYKKIIARNIMSSIFALLNNKIGEFQSADESEAATRCLYMDDINDVMDCVEDIELLWKSESIKKAYAIRNQFQIPESCRYFMNRIRTVMALSYVPSNEDILNTRVRTTGIIENTFDVRIDGVRSRLIFIDVGGQRNERRKWIHIFDNVMLIIFITAISEYDEVLEEDPDMNRIKESLCLFSKILQYRWFSETSIILFLNKKDVFKEKVEAGSNVSDYFPEYTGEPMNERSAMKFFREKYESLNKERRSRTIYIHETQATDTENMNVINDVIHDIIMHKILAEAHLN